ncbi:hypothetical protein K491DRAFT_714893 [Lophiostoma macrostomum CBS 122681]|uniref:Zn(2)-C6 fungal-type domain-containing protein n=1 Tax=Lophiostoma macrostomum CBS 122681 TaxID=1314788 RepID=A0A6A6TB03_9PLEO|nr:hypothetical protein K491DRAFT_714893 [Lophiostoma macrostomum CBS 122681]
MVYRGKPSTGCKKCRQRKIKCDERPGGCLKCSDRGYNCPGYDDPLDRLFQNESARVESKAKKANEKAIELRSEREFKIQSRKAIIKIQDAIGSPLLCPLIDQGIAFFMMNYTIGLDQPPLQSVSYNRHLASHGFHPVIANAMTALGLSGIGNIYNDFNYQREASRWYLKALKMTNDALASPTEAKSDNTLLATMLLSNFEATSNGTSLAGFLNHINGSSTLLCLRGKQQFATPAGRRMYMQTVGVLTMMQMGRGDPLPDYVHRLNQESAKYEDMNDPGDQFYHLQIETIDFRAQIIHEEITDLYAILEKALAIDVKGQRILDALREAWCYESVRVEPNTPSVFGDTYHIYPSLDAAQKWNWVRYNLIYIHDVIRNTLLMGFSSRPPVFTGERFARLLQESTEMLYDMQYGILASIPQHLYDTPKSFSEITLPTVTSPDKPRYFWSNFNETPAGDKPNMEVQDRLPIVRISGGYSSMWALYIAGATPIASPESQEYILTSFKRIKAEFGINQAQVLAGMLRLRMQLDASGLIPMAIAPRYIPFGQHLDPEEVEST